MISVNKSNVLTSNNFGLNSFLTDEKELFLPFKKCKAQFENCENQEVENGADFSLVQNLFEANGKGEEKTIHIKESSKKPIYVTLQTDDRAFEKMKFLCYQGVCAKLVVHTCTKEFLKSEIFFELQKKAKLEVIILCEGENKNFCNVQTLIKDDASLKITMFDFCEGTSVYNIVSRNENQKSTFDLGFLYSKIKAQKIDINILAENYGKFSESKIDVIGALDGLAEKSFKGVIDFKKGAQKSVGKEKEFAILLSQGVKSKSLPVLMCGEEDVEGEHSASSGKLLDDAIFYITSRGINQNDAKKLLIKAKFNKILKNVFDEKLATKICEKIDRSVSCGTNWF